MPEPVSRDTAVAALLRLEYEIIAEEGDLVVISDSNYPVRPLKLDFNQGDIPWDDFREILEYEGVNVASFLAELESM